MPLSPFPFYLKIIVQATESTALNEKSKDSIKNLEEGEGNISWHILSYYTNSCR